MNFSDIFKKSFLEGFGSTGVNTYTIIAAMLVTCILALYIFVIYRVVTKNTFYSKSFNISLAAMSIITAGIILTIQSSVVISLGMVGALSIVRFRTAIKDPMDLVFLFWSISIGIICGAGLAHIAIVVSLVVTAAVFVLDRFPVAKAPMILVINSTDIDSENEIIGVVKQHAAHIKVKSRNMTASGMDIIVETRTDKGSELVRAVMDVNGVESASLISHDGEVTF